MTEQDLPLFFATLRLCQNAKLLIIAGSVTGKYYINEFLHRFAPKSGYTLTPPFNRSSHPGKAKTCMHLLASDGRELPVFFCSTSPSARDKTLLPQRIRTHATELRRVLGQGFTTAPE